MLKLSQNAAAKVRSMRDELGDDSKFLRVFVENGGCSGFQYGMSFDVVKPGDEKIESDGVTLLVDSESLSHLKGSMIEFDDGLHGKGFEIINPNARTTCGCGKSFA